jgi:hypothetical protein
MFWFPQFVFLDLISLCWLLVRFIGITVKVHGQIQGSGKMSCITYELQNSMWVEQIKVEIPVMWGMTLLLACSSLCVQGPLDSEEEHIKIFWNVRNYVPNNPVSYPQSLDSSALPLCECQISYQNVMWPVIVQQSYIVIIQKFLSVITVCNENWCYTRRQELSLI